MSKYTILDWDGTASGNTDLGASLNTSGTGLVSTADDSFREIMAQVSRYNKDLVGLGVTVGGNANAVTLAVNQPWTALADGQVVGWKHTGGPNTGAMTVTVTPSGGAAFATKDLVQNGGAAFVGGEIPDNAYVIARYDATLDDYVQINGGGGAVAASLAEVLAGTNTAKFVSPATAAAVRHRRNRLVNPAMQVSQENSNTSGTTNGYYAADQWAMYRVTSAGTITAQRVQSQTIYKSKDRFRVTITAADASLAAGEYLTINQNIEGQEVADFAYGAAGARQSVLRFGFKGPAGTYAVSLKNSALNRSYVKTFSPTTANTDEMISLVIPGDTSGTWLTDTGIGISLDIVLAAGSTFQGTDAAWQSGNILGTSGVSNGMGTISSVFEIFDVGLYLDAESTSAAPPWELPDFDDTLRQCQRYYFRQTSTTAQTAIAAGVFNSTTQGRHGFRFPVEMRTGVPVFSVSNGADFQCTTSGGVLDTTDLTGTQTDAYSARLDATISGATSGGGSLLTFDATIGRWFAFNARM